MSKFAVKSIAAVRGRQQFKQLVIVNDDIDVRQLQEDLDNGKADIEGVLDLYAKNLEQKYESSLRGILAIMNRIAELQTVPQQKFKSITPFGDPVKEYEFKFQDLRVYAIKIRNGP